MTTQHVRAKMKTHDLRDSPLYKVRSRKRLANILFTIESSLILLARSESNYHSFQKKKKDGSPRTIDAPNPGLKRIQSRIADLLQRITPPDFLMSPVRGRSYVHNANHHLCSNSFHCIDLENYFPRCMETNVKLFFRDTMKCSPDVAYLLGRLTCKDGHLPQGSPCSLILAYFSNSGMWEEVGRLVAESDCTFSVYADDLTISGERVPKSLVWEITKVIFRNNHRVQRKKVRRRTNGIAEITGVVVRNGRLVPPNRQHQALDMARKDLNCADNSEIRKKIERSIQGRLAQIQQIENHNANSQTDDTSH